MTQSVASIKYEDRAKGAGHRQGFPIQIRKGSKGSEEGMQAFWKIFWLFIRKWHVLVYFYELFSDEEIQIEQI